MTYEIGALMRIYVSQPDRVTDFLEEAVATVEHLRLVGIRKCFFSVWRDVNQPDSDCGFTAGRMLETFAGDEDVTVIISAGDLFVDAFNNALPSMMAGGVTHALVLSMTARHLITRQVLAGVKEAIEKDQAQVVAIVHPDFRDLVLKGYVTNTHAVWDLAALLSQGGFSAIDKRPLGFDSAVHIQGVGEAMNALTLSWQSGRPIQAILDTGNGSGDTRTDELHRRKIANKDRRAEAMLKAFGVTWDDLADTIIPGYPKRV